MKRAIHTLRRKDLRLHLVLIYLVSPPMQPRTDVFITSKLACPFHKPQHVEPALRKTLLDLRIGYLDLFLIHWPVAFNYVNFDPTMRGWPNEGADESKRVVLYCFQISSSQ